MMECWNIGLRKNKTVKEKIRHSIEAGEKRVDRQKGQGMIII